MEIKSSTVPFAHLFFCVMLLVIDTSCKDRRITLSHTPRKSQEIDPNFERTTFPQFLGLIEDSCLERISAILDVHKDYAALNNNAALFQAITANRFDVTKTLVEFGSDVNGCNRKNLFSPLHLAALRANYYIVLYLIDQGADVNSRSRLGETPLMFASLYGKERVVRLLINRGAKVTTLNSQGQSALFYACRCPIFGDDKQIDRHLLDVIEFLIKHGCNVSHIDKEGNTALHIAAANRRGDDRVARLLIKHGLDPSKKNSRGLTPLDIAQRTYDRQKKERMPASRDLIECLKQGRG